MLNLSLTQVIQIVFEGEELTEAHGRAIWVMLANADLYPTFNLITEPWDTSYNISGSFRYNGGEIARAIDKDKYDYLDFYCSSATWEEVSEMMDKFKAKGFVVVPDMEYPNYYVA